jgi:hypothetical protein
LNLTETDFTESYQVIQLGHPPLRIDLMTSIGAIPSFEDAWQERAPGLFGALAVNYLGRRHLILNKTSTGRAKDVGDAEELSELQP